MVSQAALRLLEVTPIAGDPTRVRATIDLRCGCRVTRVIAADRIVETKGGSRRAVGKYPCPKGHPVTRDA